MEFAEADTKQLRTTLMILRECKRSAEARGASCMRGCSTRWDGIIRRIVRVAEPERINLFGSAVRGEMNRHSDVDLLLSKKACTDGIWPDESTKISGG